MIFKLVGSQNSVLEWFHVGLCKLGPVTIPHFWNITWTIPELEFYTNSWERFKILDIRIG
jgi:hypothetical protein